MRWLPRRLAVLVCLVAAADATPALPAAAGGRVVDLAGRPTDPLEHRGKAATVLVFTRTDCPIANRYAPELRRLHDTYAPKGAAFWLVYVDPAETVETIEQHRRSFGLGFEALRDLDHSLVGLTGATVTPEVAVFTGASEEPRLVYRGRIDDRAVELGRIRPTPTRRDLAEVLEALVSGGAVLPHTTKAVGCFISALP